MSISKQEIIESKIRNQEMAIKSTKKLLKSTCFELRNLYSHIEKLNIEQKQKNDIFEYLKSVLDSVDTFSNLLLKEVSRLYDLQKIADNNNDQPILEMIEKVIEEIDLKDILRTLQKAKKLQERGNYEL